MTDKSPVDPDLTAGSGMFARKSSGLVREIGIKEVVALAAGFLAISFFYAGVTAALALFPNGDLTLPLLLAGGIWLVTTVMYWQLTSAMPRSGGDYVYASRVFSPAVGSVVGLALLVVLMLTLALNGQILMLTLSFGFYALSTVFDVQFFTDAAEWVVTPDGTLIGGIATILVSAGIVWFLPIRRVAAIVFGAVLISLIGFVVATLAMLFTSQAGFATDFAAFAGGNTNAVSDVIAAAQGAGWSPGVTTAGVLGLVAIAFLGYLGVTSANATAGEVRRPDRTYILGVGGTLLAVIVLYVVAWLAMKHAVGLDFIQASYFLTGADPEALGAITSAPLGFSGIFYALVVVPDPLRVILAVAFPATYIAGPIVLTVLTSRLAFALALDRLLPAKLAEVSPRTHAPTYAVMIAAAGAVAFLILGRYSSTLSSLLSNITVVFAAIFFIASLAAIALPYRRPDIYAATPKSLGDRWLGLPPIVIIGTVSALLNGLMVYLVAFKPEYRGEYNEVSYIVLAIVVLAGPVIYAIRRVTQRGLGLDPRLAMRELPPE